LNSIKTEGQNFDFSLGDYFQEIGKSPLLTQEEERELSRKIKQRRNQLINLLFRITSFVAANPRLLKFFAEAGYSRQDLTRIHDNMDKVRVLVNFVARNKNKIVEMAGSEGRKINDTINSLLRAKDIYEQYKREMMEAK